MVIFREPAGPVHVVGVVCYACKLCMLCTRGWRGPSPGEGGRKGAAVKVKVCSSDAAKEDVYGT